ncbi:Acetyltransferase (GNAT) family protein [Marinomonas gallaica]|uniref:Acetyltransferase (GNAT) family protein n=2 Tax=Marinomonas gallaica TaxID=1806667 RepID=A0A1C3JS67_9GAMM|nr:Acetyltransferase (GNAT) family protein [Marinomonas gallaica]SBT20734.1 Acetyltransferase (GNAT) family protein [Marinomonas gallaica]
MIRAMTEADFKAFWPTFSAVIKAQETYAYRADMTQEQAYEIWCMLPAKTYVFEEEGEVLATYYLKANAMGPGDHVCNCGYMVSEKARGKGLARKLCEHSQQVARNLGFTGMQFNAVVSTNRVAVQLWQKLGYDIIGTVPNAYRHGRLGKVDCLIMYKDISQD